MKKCLPFMAIYNCRSTRLCHSRHRTFPKSRSGQRSSVQHPSSNNTSNDSTESRPIMKADDMLRIQRCPVWQTSSVLFLLHHSPSVSSPLAPNDAWYSRACRSSTQETLLPSPSDRRELLCCSCGAGPICAGL